MSEDSKKLDHMSQEPVHQYKGVWWFWNETFDKRMGSYITEVGADEGFRLYVQNLNEQKEEKEKLSKELK